MTIALIVNTAGEEWDCDVCGREFSMGEKCVTVNSPQGDLADICLDCMRKLFATLKKEAP